MQQVKIATGTYRGQEVTNQVFTLVKDVTAGTKGHFITVRPNTEIGQGKDKIRVTIVSHDHVEYITEEVESDEAIMERIGERFDILTEMTSATTDGSIRSMIVTGAAGIGKSYGIIEELKKCSIMDIMRNGDVKYEIVKGSSTAIGLYSTLYNNSDKDSVLVFDDCDSVFYDDVSLNLLKAALDTTGKRNLSWTSASKYLEKEGIPSVFQFKGSIIFVTNLNFDNIKSAKLQEHLTALMSRCHYLDLTIATTREKFLRIKQIYRTGALFKKCGLTTEQEEEIITWIEKNKETVRELSLRLAIKCAELCSLQSSIGWQRMAEVTLCKNR